MICLSLSRFLGDTVFPGKFHLEGVAVCNENKYLTDLQFGCAAKLPSFSHNECFSGDGSLSDKCKSNLVVGCLRPEVFHYFVTRSIWLFLM